MLRLEFPEVWGKAFPLPKRLAEAAPTNEWASRMLRRILRTELKRLMGQAHAETSRLLLRDLMDTPPDRPRLVIVRSGAVELFQMLAARYAGDPSRPQ